MITTKYYNNYTKDEVLLASKRAFIVAQDDKYIIDSYRDRLEVTKIELFYHFVGNKVTVKEYLVEVEEDDFGTIAKMTIQGYYDPDKKGQYYVDKDEHSYIWDKVDFFLKQKDSFYIDAYHYSKGSDLQESFKVNTAGSYYDKLINPTKVQKASHEFKNGLIGDEHTSVEIESIITQPDEVVEEIIENIESNEDEIILK